MHMSMATLNVVWAVLAIYGLINQAIGGQLISFTKEDFPDPTKNYTECGRDSASWVCDPGRYLTAAQGDELNRIAETVNTFMSAGPIIMIGVVPRIVISDGNPITSLIGISNFTLYLRDTSWNIYPQPLIVIVYHIARNEIWLARGSYGAITLSCICQVTYESRKFFSESEFHIAINIFVRKIVDVIRGDSVCSVVTDNVPWMVSNLGECTWNEELIVDRVMPLTGLPDGGGLLVITGDNLGAAPYVLIGPNSCNSTSSPSNNMITCVVPPLSSNTALNIPIPVYLLIYGDIQYDTGWRYTYTEPTLTTLRPLTTIVSGGLNLTVEGKNLNLVTYARMLVTLRGTTTGKTQTYSTTCRIQSPLYMLCPTPKLDLDAVRTRKKKRDILNRLIIMKKNRAIRAATQDADSIIVDDVEISVEILLDGENVRLEEYGNTPPMLQTYEDPDLQSFSGQDRTLTFVSVWPKSDRTIDIKGSRLLPALRGHTLSILIGRSRCEDVEIYTNQLICRPPVSKPPANGTHPSVEANVGNLEFSIGYLEYIDNIWDYLPLRYGIIGGGAGLLLIIIVIVVCCCCKRS